MNVGSSHVFLNFFYWRYTFSAFGKDCRPIMHREDVQETCACQTKQSCQKLESLQMPYFNSFHDSCPGRCGDGDEGMCVLGKASWTTRPALSCGNHRSGGLGYRLRGSKTVDSHMTGVLDTEGVGLQKWAIRSRLCVCPGGSLCSLPKIKIQNLQC